MTQFYPMWAEANRNRSHGQAIKMGPNGWGQQMYYVADAETTLVEGTEDDAFDTHTADVECPCGQHLIPSEPHGTLTGYRGTDLTPNMSIRLDGHDWNIDSVFPYSEIAAYSDGRFSIGRDATKSILQLATFIRHQGTHYAAYVIDNGDTFQVIV